MNFDEMKKLYNDKGIRCDKYMEFLSTVNSVSISGYYADHHILLTSIFGDNDETICLSGLDHTRAHLYLVQDNLELYSTNPTADLMKIYKALDIRYYKAGNSWYPEDAEAYINIMNYLNGVFDAYLQNDPSLAKTYDNMHALKARWSDEKQREHQSKLSSMNYALNTEMVRKMKENSVLDSEKQSRKTQIRNFRQYTVLRLIEMYDNNYEFNKDNYRDMYSYQTKYNHVWWEFLLYKTYYLKYYGLRQDILDKWYKEADEYIKSDEGVKTKKWLIVTGIDVDDQNFSFLNETYQMDLFPDNTVEEENKIKALVKRINESN